MTTIAWDGATVAADSLVIGPSSIRSTAAQKLRVVGDTVYGMTGAFALFDPLVAWHRAGAVPDQFPNLYGETDWTLIVIDGGDAVFYGPTPYPDASKAAPPQAWGSGWEVAMGALLAGKSAAEAVVIAMEVDLATGGKVRVVYPSDLRRKEAAE